MSNQQQPAVDYGELMKKVEQLAGDIEGLDDIGETIHHLVNEVTQRFRKELGIFGGRLYERDGDFYLLEATFPESRRELIGLRVPVSYPPVEQLLDEGALFMKRDDPRLDPAIERRLGVRDFAAIEVGDEGFDYILAFDVEPGIERSNVLFSLGILRHGINQKVREERLRGAMREARRIQASILPRRDPEHGRYDICGRTRSLDIVGGDFFDYIPITDKVLGLAVADVSGHGLPAALQVRDIYTGLRMGLSRDYKIVRTVERLNAIIHESTLTSRFVSMFYGELDLNGVFIYVNAGHPPPYHLRSDGSARPLREGGAVLGPLAEATYERGYINLRRGELILLYTDGIVETPGTTARGRPTEYGSRRLLRTVRRHREEAAERIVEAIFADLEAFAGGRPQHDDRTLVVVRRPG